MASEAVKVRRARLEDVPGIVAVHRTHVLDGNPWLEVVTCAAHLNNFLVNGHAALVAELAGRVVGEAELFVADEVPYGRVAALNVLCVHESVRRQGVGRALMERALRISRSAGATVFHVWPEAEALPFYHRLGLELTDELVTVRCASVPERRPVRAELRGEDPYDTVAGLLHVFGRHISSRHSWWVTSRWSQLAGRWKGEVPRRWRLSVGRLPAWVAFRRRSPREVWGHGWLHPDGSSGALWGRMLRLARSEGFRVLRTLMFKSTYEDLARRFPLKRDGSELLLARRL